MYRINVDTGVCCAVQDTNPRGRRTVLFVHGWPFDHQIFSSQFVVLPQYGIRCIGVDLRGFGASDRPFQGYSYDRLTEDLHRIICSLDTKCVTLCGFSMGGAICVRYLARYGAARVNKLILCGAAAPSFVQRPGYPVGMSREQVDSLISDAYNNLPAMCASFVPMCFAQNPGPDYIQWMCNIATRADNGAVIKTAQSLRDEDLRSDLGKIKVPTAILHGTHDRICPFTFAEMMNKGIGNSFIVPFEQSGHCLMFEEKDKCNNTIVDFVNASV